MLSTFSIRALKILIIITIFPFGQFLHLCHNWFWCSFLFFWLCFFFSFHYALSGFWSWPWCNRRRRQWHPTPVLLPGKSHARRSLVGCSPWGREESDTTERLHFHFSLSCIGEGNGNPLHCSCLENPRDWGAWWASVYGVAQSRIRLTQFSSSSMM